MWFLRRQLNSVFSINLNQCTRAIDTVAAMDTAWDSVWCNVGGWIAGVHERLELCVVNVGRLDPGVRELRSGLA